MLKKNLKRVILMALTIAFVTALSLTAFGCGSSSGGHGGAKVVFELEGGTYKNCVLPVIHYYDVGEGESNTIADPTDAKYSKDGITRSGYVFTGWYRTKTGEGENTQYLDKWDFSSDKITSEGITLYAGWEKETKFTYDVCYRNDDGELVVIDSYRVQKGAKFDDYAKYANKRFGYTAIPSAVRENGDVWLYWTEDGAVWDANFTHPGDENAPNVKVVVKYIEGTYSIVTKANDLKRSKNANIYLACDIDLDGEEFNFGDYKKTFLGNGHTISNFKISYDNTKNGVITDFESENDKSLYVSLFGMGEGAVIKDVTFDSVSVVIDAGYSLTYKIYVSPIFSMMSGCTIENVTFNANYSYIKLPNESFYEEGNLVYVTDRAYYLMGDGESTIENVQISVNVDNQ